MESMALRAPRPHEQSDENAPPIHWVTAEEGRVMFNDAVRRAMGYSGEEFIQRWKVGEFATIPDDLDHRHIIDLVLMIPLAG